MRSFLITVAQFFFTMAMYGMGIIYFGIALAPGVFFLLITWEKTLYAPLWLRCIALGLSVAMGYFLFGLTLVAIAGGTRTFLRIRLKEGTYRIFSLGTLKWAFVSSLYLLINFTFIYFLLLTPFANLLLKLLGAKVGKNVQINSKFIFDATLLEIGDNTVIGGGAIIIGHQVERGHLKLRRVKIGKNVTIGSNAIVSPGCEIGDHTIIGAGAVLLKNTKIEPRSVWAGVPAHDARAKCNQGV